MSLAATVLSTSEWAFALRGGDAADHDRGHSRNADSPKQHMFIGGYLGRMRWRRSRSALLKGHLGSGQDARGERQSIGDLDRAADGGDFYRVLIHADDGLRTGIGCLHLELACINC